MGLNLDSQQKFEDLNQNTPQSYVLSCNVTSQRTPFLAAVSQGMELINDLQISITKMSRRGAFLFRVAYTTHGMIACLGLECNTTAIVNVVELQTWFNEHLDLVSGGCTRASSHRRYAVERYWKHLER
jgi:hypothetical protein